MNLEHCAIKTKFLAVTNFKGARFKASIYGCKESITIGMDYSLNREENHRRTAMQLAFKLAGNKKPFKIESRELETGCFVHFATYLNKEDING